MSSRMQTPNRYAADEVYVSGAIGAVTDAAGESEEITRVLVADGNATVRKILWHNINTLAWQIIEAEDGEQALRLANDSRAPHAFQLELNLAKIDGYEVESAESLEIKED